MLEYLEIENFKAFFTETKFENGSTDFDLRSKLIRKKLNNTINYDD